MMVPKVKERFSQFIYQKGCARQLTMQGLLGKQKTAGTRWLLSIMETKWKHKKDKVIYLSVSEYSPVVPNIAKSGLMDGKCYR